MIHNGIYEKALDIPRMDYISWSKISAMLHSPKKFFSQYREGAKRTEPSKAMLLGNYVHMFLLERDKFMASHVIQPDFGPMQSPKNRATRDAWKMEMERKSKIVLDEATLDTIVEMSEDVAHHPKAVELLSHGSPESWVYSYSERFQKYMLGRPDFTCQFIDEYGREKKAIVEIKTISSGVKLRNIRSEIFDEERNYDGQLAFNCLAYGSLIGDVDFDSAFWIFVKSTKPFDTAVYKLSRDVYLNGLKKTLDGLNMLEKYLNLDPDLKYKHLWPGVQFNRVDTLELEPWAQYEEKHDPENDYNNGVEL